MPAPVPITIRYGDPTAMGRLAAATGSAEYAQERYNQDYDGWLRRMAMDNQLLDSEMDRRAQDTWRRNQLSFDYSQAGNSRDAAFALQDATRYAAPAPARVAAQAAGNMSGGRQNAPLSLVPADGVRPGSSRMESSDGNTYIRDGGTIRRHDVTTADVSSLSDLPAVSGRGAFPGRDSSDMVTPDVKGQLDYLKSIQSQIPADQWNPAWVTAARSGQLNMNQLIDTVQQDTRPASAGRMSLADQSAEKYQQDAQELAAIRGLSASQQASYARRKLVLDAFLYQDDDEGALAELDNYAAELKAKMMPVTNSSGRTPTGGNPVRVNTPDEARQLPSGSYFQTPDGRVMRVP